MKRFLMLLCVSFAGSNFALADDAKVKGDIEYGEYLSGECVTCHSAAGADKGIPPINGLDPDGFVDILKAYKEKDLENEAMRLIASRLDDEQMASLAIYFASKEPAE